MSTNTNFELTYPNGAKYTVDRNQLWGMLTSKGRLQEVSVSSKEGRVRVKFETVEKFISGRRNYERMWQLIDMVQDPEMQREATRLGNLAIQKDIFETEEWFTQMIQVMFSKDNLLPYWRNPDNPYVKAGWDIQMAIGNAGMIGEGRQGA